MLDQASPLSVKIIKQTILDEIYKSLGVSTHVWFRNILDPLLGIPVHRFSQICYQLNQKIAEKGLSLAACDILAYFISVIHYDNLESVPATGPLLVISNHCGATDTVCITAGLNRDDLQIIAYEVPFYNTLPEVSKHFFYTTDDQHDRMKALRDSIRHLRSGGALLLFGTGKIDPDPSVLPGAEIELDDWSHSIPIIINNVPGIQILICIASGVVSARFARHPIIHLRKEKMDQRRLAEFFQIMYQMIFRTNLDLHPRITFSKPFTSEDLQKNYPDQNVRDAIIQQAKNLLLENLNTSDLNTIPTAQSPAVATPG